jgi:hypothetical protein
MTCRGHIQNGGVVLDEPVSLPDGSEVECVVRVLDQPKQEEAKSFYEHMKEFAGAATSLPEDSSINIDHYLYGHPKR